MAVPLARPIVLFFILALFGCGGGEPESGAEGGVTLRVAVDPVAKAREVNEALAAEFTEQTGIEVEFIEGPMDSTERLSQYLQYLGARSPDIDVYQIDVIWPGILARHFADLAPAFGGEASEFFEPIVENNTVEGRLVAAPYFGDAGLLYYRTDLLEKYGFDDPPATWNELERQARTIQEGERAAGNAGFWGWVWQGRAYEGLTCNALEWQASHGGGRILEPIEGGGARVTVNNPETLAALTRAAAWVGSISPPGVTSYAEEEARILFQKGNAAFMRNWPYAYALGNEPDSPIRGNFAVTVLPESGGGHAATLGGWQWAVSQYSEHGEQAIALVRHLASREANVRRAREAGLLPTRPEVFDDPSLIEAIPYLPSLRPVFETATPRPAGAAGQDYNEVSTRYFQTVHRILSGEAEAEPALADVEQTLREILE